MQGDAVEVRALEALGRGEDALQLAEVLDGANAIAADAFQQVHGSLEGGDRLADADYGSSGYARATESYRVPSRAFVADPADEVEYCRCRAAYPPEFIRTDRGMPGVTITPTSYSQPPVKPARRKPATTYGQRRMMLQINPVR